MLPRSTILRRRLLPALTLPHPQGYNSDMAIPYQRLPLLKPPPINVHAPDRLAIPGVICPALDGMGTVSVHAAPPAPAFHMRTMLPICEVQ